MWLLNWLPDWVFHMMLISSVVLLLASWVLSFIPFVIQYRLPLQVMGILLLVTSIWYEGGIAKDREYRSIMAEYKLKVATAETAAAEANAKIQIKIVTKTQTIREKGATVIEYIDREVTKYDNLCPIPASVVISHNASAKNVKVEELTK